MVIQLYQKEHTGLYVEEALNSIEEAKVLCELFKVDDVKQINGYVSSAYQGLMYTIMEVFVKVIGELPFSTLRLLGSDTDFKKFEEFLIETPSYNKLLTEEYAEEKRKIFGEVENLENVYPETKERIKKFFSEYDGVYFKSYSSHDTFLSILDNVFNQIYNLNTMRYNFNISELKNGRMETNENNNTIYNDVISCIYNEVLLPLREAGEKIKAYKSSESLVNQASENVCSSQENTSNQL